MASAASTGASTFTKIEAIINNRELYELGELVPKHEPGDVGRPRDFPDYTAFLFDALISVFGSANKVETELAVTTSGTSFVERSRRPTSSIPSGGYRHNAIPVIITTTPGIPTFRTRCCWSAYNNDNEKSPHGKRENLVCLMKVAKAASRWEWQS